MDAIKTKAGGTADRLTPLEGRNEGGRMCRRDAFEDNRRVRAMHIGAGLRHLRRAAALNLNDAPEEQIRNEAARVVDSLGPLVWRMGRPDE